MPHPASPSPPHDRRPYPGRLDSGVTPLHPVTPPLTPNPSVVRAPASAMGGWQGAFHLKSPHWPTSFVHWGRSCMYPLYRMGSPPAISHPIRLCHAWWWWCFCLVLCLSETVSVELALSGSKPVLLVDPPSLLLRKQLRRLPSISLLPWFFGSAMPLSDSVRGMGGCGRG